MEVVWILLLILALALNALLASKASHVAEDKGYEKSIWFHMCFWLAPISYIIVAAMPDLTMRKKQDETNKLLEKLISFQSAALQQTNVKKSSTAQKMEIKKSSEVGFSPKVVKRNANDQISFGAYPQTKDGNDRMPIKWEVVAREDKKALLVSYYGLDVHPYNTGNVNVTWEECTLRKWLNEDFLNSAFTQEEQTKILLTNVKNDANQGYTNWKTEGGNDTQDKVFLLSYAEAQAYFNVTYDDERQNVAARVEPTDYAIAQGAWTSNKDRTIEGNAAGWWWLRSPGSNQKLAAIVAADGTLYNQFVSSFSCFVRPALWVNLEQ